MLFRANPVTDSSLNDLRSALRQQINNKTKRAMISIASQIYDSLGFIEPFTVKIKIMMQEL